MSKVLYIHIGNFKTGTSAIQKFCHDHSEALQKAGLYYFKSCRPERNHTNHGRLSLELFKKFGGNPPGWYVDEYSYDSAVTEIKKEIVENSSFDKYLISSEEFYRLGGLSNSQEVIQTLKQSFNGLDIDIKIIMYAREPLAFLTSWYNQVTKGDGQPTRTFNDFVWNIPEFFIDPYINYDVWSDVFGKDNIIVKEYQYKGNEHLKDFLGVITPEFSGFQDDKVFAVNTGLTSEKLETSRIKKLIKSYSTNNLNEQGKINNFVNSRVLLDADKQRDLSQKINTVYHKNHDFYTKFFDKEPRSLDVFDVIETSANLNYINMMTFWALNPSIEMLISKAASLKESNAEISLELFKIAKKSRPNGEFIQKSIRDLEATDSDVTQ